MLHSFVEDRIATVAHLLKEVLFSNTSDDCTEMTKWGLVVSLIGGERFFHLNQLWFGKAAMTNEDELPVRPECAALPRVHGCRV